LTKSANLAKLFLGLLKAKMTPKSQINTLTKETKDKNIKRIIKNNTNRK